MRVAKKNEPFDAGGAQDRGDVGWFGRLRVQIPIAAFGKPATNRGEQTRRVEVRVDVDQFLNQPLGSTARLTLICFTSVYASKPYVPSSRPMPDCL